MRPPSIGCCTTIATRIRISTIRGCRRCGRRDPQALPPAHIHTAEFDPLRDEGAAYAEQLRGAGIAARYTCHAGMIHYFYAMAGAIPAARLALMAAAAAMGEALVAGSALVGEAPAAHNRQM